MIASHLRAYRREWNSYVVFLVMWRKLYYLSDSHFSSHFDTT